MRLRQLRASRFLTMERLAQMAGLSVSTVRDTEAGRHKPSLITCAKLAAALEVSMEEIDECRGALDEGNKLAPATV